MINPVKDKKILLLCTKFFNYDQLVANKLKELGAIVDLYDARAELNTAEKAVLKYYKGFFYAKLRKYHKRIVESNREKEYDIIYTNSYLPEETVVQYKNAFPKAKLLFYLDDSVANMKNANKTFSYYDRVMTFDRSDSIKYQIDLIPLFYEDSYKKNSGNDYKYDICFIGTIHSDRLKVIEAIEKECLEKGLTFFHYCYLQSRVMYLVYWITKSEFRRKAPSYFQFNQIPSCEVADILLKSKAVLDIQHPRQTGLTMRTIETLGAGKKIITTNKEIQYYDIYNESNVCIIDRNNPDINSYFINSEYEELQTSIIEKYSIGGWIAQVFM